MATNLLPYLFVRREESRKCAEQAFFVVNESLFGNHELNYQILSHSIKFHEELRKPFCCEVRYLHYFI